MANIVVDYRSMNMDGRQSTALPPIESLRSRMLKEEEAEYYPRRSALPVLDTSATLIRHTSSPYHTPHLDSEHLNNSSSITSAPPNLVNCTQRRSSGEQAVIQNTNGQATRCSLPSIYEALGIGKNSPGPSANRTSTPTLPRTSQLPESKSPASQSSQQAQNSGYGSHDRDSASDWHKSRTPFIGSIGPASPLPKSTQIAGGSNAASPHPNQQDTRLHSQPVKPYKDENNAYSPRNVQNYAPISSEANTPHNKDATSPTYSSTPIPRQPQPVQRQQSGDNSRPSGIRKHTKAYGESVKRHLEVFDLEQALNGVYDASKQLLEFSDFYRQKAHQTQRSGPLPGSTPHLQEIDDMMENGNHVHDALTCIREVVVNQQAALAERSREQAIKSLPQPREDRESLHEESNEGTFIGSDPKRRRGRAAPPGRCHSCNRAETPEWRRGPDGARTLCNACGLHYAKLTRKMGATKSSAGSSNLRPKVTV